MPRYRLIKLNEKQYSESQSIELFENTENPRGYALLTFDSLVELRVAWQSDLMEPSIIEVDENKISIGIDLNFALVDCDKGVFKSFDLDYFFIDAFVHKSFVYVCTEMNILKINMSGFVLHNQPLPSLFVSSKELGDSILIECEDGKVLEITE